MTTLKNIDTAKAETVFSMTGFNYDIAEVIDNDGTSEIMFDCEKDAAKFEMLYSEIN